MVLPVCEISIDLLMIYQGHPTVAERETSWLDKLFANHLCSKRYIESSIHSRKLILDCRNCGICTLLCQRNWF